MPSIGWLLLNLPAAGALVFALSVHGRGWPLHRWFWPALLLKISAGWAVGAVYTFYYGYGDTLAMFADALTIREFFDDNPSEGLYFLLFGNVKDYPVLAYQLLNDSPRAVLFSKYITVVNLLTGGNYWLTSLYFSIGSFWGIWMVANLLVRLQAALHLPVIASFLLLPSCVFWSAGILKESLQMLTMCLLLYVPLRYELYRKGQTSNPLTFSAKQWLRVPLLLWAIYVLWAMKYYYFAVLVPFALAFLLVRVSSQLPVAERLRGKPLTEWNQSALFFPMLLILLLPASYSHPNLYPGAVWEAVVRNNEIMAAQSSKQENLIRFRELSTTAESLVRNLPVAFWEGFFRPYLWEHGNWLKKAAAVESFLLLLLSAGACFRLVQLRHYLKANWSMAAGALLLFCLLLEVMLTFSAPNIGNLVRYRAGFLPLWVMLLLCLLRLRPEGAKGEKTPD